MISSKMRLCQEYVRDGKLLTRKSINIPISQEMVLKTIEACSAIGQKIHPVSAVMLYKNPETGVPYCIEEAIEIVKEIGLG